MRYAIKCDSMDDVIKVVSIHDKTCYIPNKDHIAKVIQVQGVIRIISGLSAGYHKWTYSSYMYNDHAKKFHPLLSVNEFLNMHK